MRDFFHLATARAEARGEDGEIMLYGEIVQNGAWFKNEDDRSAKDFDKAVKELKNGGVKNITVRVNSPGGVVTEAVAMRAILAGAGFEKIKFKIEGLCASAATLITTLPGAEAEIAPGSMYMIHNPWTVAIGTADDFEHEAENLHAIERDTRAFYAKKSGQDEEQIREWMEKETWFTAEEAVENGFCDRVSEEETNAEPAAACVTRAQMRVMKTMYTHIPETVKEETEEEPENNGSNAGPVAGIATVNKNNEEGTQMDTNIAEMTVEQLREANPALYEQIRQDAREEALREDQERRNDIAALTMTGYEEMAKEACDTGMSAMDFMKAVASAQKAKAASFREERKAETEQVKEIAGDAPDGAAGEDIDAFAREMAEMGKSYIGNMKNGMY